MFFDFFWDDCNTQEKLETMIMQNWGGGGGVKMVYYGLCENGKFAIFIFYSSLLFLIKNLTEKKKSWLSTTKRQFIITAIGLAEDGRESGQAYE